MYRQCYHCSKELTLEEAVEGQIALDKANAQYDDFEGWVHCQGPVTEFISEDDTELKQALEQAGCIFFPHTIHVHRRCVEEVFYQESGRRLYW